jgi:signal recognition particle subunit SRP54
MMKQMAGQFGFGSRSATRKQAKSRKGKKPQQKARGGRPQPARAGMPDLTGLPPSLQQLPPGLDQLPAGFDLSKLKFPPKGK